MTAEFTPTHMFNGEVPVYHVSTNRYVDEAGKVHFVGRGRRALQIGIEPVGPIPECFPEAVGELVFIPSHAFGLACQAMAVTSGGFAFDHIGNVAERRGPNRVRVSVNRGPMHLDLGQDRYEFEMPDSIPIRAERV